MTPMKFIHCADIHLDSPLRGLERYEGAPVDEVRNATRRALEKLIDLALDERVSFVVIAGDLFDGDWRDFNTGLFFVKMMVRLNEAGIKVFLIRGNHDAESKLTKQLPLPANVHVLPANSAHTLVDDTLGIAVHGQSFAQSKVYDDLAAGYPRRVSGYFNLGILHTCLSGFEGHENYAPCRLDTLRGKGYDYWALGHVHKHQIVHQDPWIIFPGNIQGRSIRETGSKGCELVTVTEGAVTTEHVPLDVLRWELLQLDAAGIDDLDSLSDRFYHQLQILLGAAQGRALAVRLEVAGRSSAHSTITVKPETVKEQLRSLALECSNGMAWLEKIGLKTQPEIDPSRLVERDDPIGELVRLIRSLRESGADLTPLAEKLNDLKHKLPVELTEGPEAIALDSPTFLKEMLATVETTLVSQLLDAVSAAPRQDEK
jgi:DNA repair exonuclease